MAEHPLMNHLVLERVFSNLDLEDVKAARLVCTRWHDSATSALWAMSQLVIQPTIAETRVTFDGIVEHISTVGRFPVKNISVVRQLVDASTNDFWQLVGEGLQTLTLTNCYFTNADFLFTVLFDFCVQLKTVVINNIEFQVHTAPTGNYRQNLNIRLLHVTLRNFYWEDIVALLPNVMDLRVRNHKLPELELMLESVQGQMQLQKLDIIDEEDAYKYIPPTVGGFLATILPTVKDLYLDFGAMTDIQTAATILKSVSQSVTRLKLYRSPAAVKWANFPFDIDFPLLQVFQCTQSVSSSIDFVSFMPNITELSINDEFEPTLEDAPLSMNLETEFVYPRITQLTIQGSLTPEGRSVIAHIFPRAILNLSFDYEINY